MYSLSDRDFYSRFECKSHFSGRLYIDSLNSFSEETGIEFGLLFVDL